jgi:hypothetical protein
MQQVLNAPDILREKRDMTITKTLAVALAALGIAIGAAGAASAGEYCPHGYGMSHANEYDAWGSAYDDEDQFDDEDAMAFDDYDDDEDEFDG